MLLLQEDKELSDSAVMLCFVTYTRGHTVQQPPSEWDRQTDGYVIALLYALSTIGQGT